MKTLQGAGEIVQRLGTPGALAEELGSAPSIHVENNNCLQLQFPGL